MQAIIIHDDDIVAVALTDLKAGSTVTVGGRDIVLKDDITRGHKFALRDIAEGEPIMKYGYAIGRAKTPITVGEHVHSHNVKTDLKGGADFTFNKVPVTPLPNRSERTFKAYVRANGQVATRNEVWIIPTVFCVNQVAKHLAEYGKALIKDCPNVDAVLALTHPFGCSQMGEDQETTQTVLAALSRHPNAAYVLVLGLGCENNNIGVFKKFLDPNDERIHFLNSQEVEDEFAAGEKLIAELVQKANAFTREEVPLSKLRLGMKCGGSDGLSGITANPLIGRLSDTIVGSGGTTVMTEVPEMFGAEQMLMNRAKDEATFKKCKDLILNFKNYFISHGEVVSENPSPGNKAGGITTLEDKSLGCVQKGGKAEISDVLTYGETLRTNGLNLLEGPGNDGVSCTALAAAGVHVILFSTGRGTPFGTVVPTIKISTNSALYNRKGNWIDFNAGAVVDGVSFEQLTDNLLDYVIAVASGELTTTERRVAQEIEKWKDGVTL